MALTMDKDTRQRIMLYATLVVMVVAAAVLLRDRFIPTPIGGALPSSTVERLQPFSAVEGTIFDRQDFKDLRRFGDVPVKPVHGGGSRQPFLSEQ